MFKLFSRLRHWLNRRKPREQGLTEIEYEAVSLIALEGRAACDKAREQAQYCLRRGSKTGHEFWLSVAGEIARRTGAARPGRARQLPR
jgi:hypothetical protein